MYETMCIFNLINYNLLEVKYLEPIPYSKAYCRSSNQEVYYKSLILTCLAEMSTTNIKIIMFLLS
jgi:hypothetical protein